MAAQHGRDVLWSAARSHKSTCISAQHRGLPNISTIFYLNVLLAEFDLQEALRQRSCPQKAADRSQGFAVGEEAKGVGSSHLAPLALPRHSSNPRHCRKRDNPTHFDNMLSGIIGDLKCLPNASVAGVRRISICGERLDW